MIGGEKIKCRRCGRQLGIIENGIFVNKHGGQIIKAERAVVSCPKCGVETKIVAAKKRVDKKTGTG